MAQQPSHVPKFGNWDNDNTPYTVYFENARKDKNGARMNPNENPEAFMVGRGRIMNPNDPEDNPEAFMLRRPSEGNGDDHYQYQVAPPSPLHVHSRKPPVDQKHQDRMRHGNVNSQQRNNSCDDPKSVSLRSITSESGSERSNSDHRGMKLNKSKSPAGSSTSSFSSSDARNKKGVPDNRPTRRGTSVPRFGTWDEKDPTSGDGFTVIFNKVKEEKHNPSVNFPTPPGQDTYSSTHQKHGTSSMSKICCCIL